MAKKWVVIDELHVTISIPADTTEAHVERVRERLFGTDFMTRFRIAVVALVRDELDPVPVRVAVTR